MLQRIDSTALGSASVAAFDRSTAVGFGATTTRVDQVTLGGAGSSVRVADIAASNAVQVGAEQVVTIDSNGTLGTSEVASAASVANVRVSVDYLAAVTDAQFSALTQNVGALGTRIDALEFGLERLDDRIAGSTAVAVAMGGAAFLPDRSFNLTANVGTYDGAHAGSVQIGALLSENVAVNAGVATGFNRRGSTAGRVGFTLGW